MRKKGYGLFFHDKLWSRIKIVTKERPLSFTALADELCIFSTPYRIQLRSALNAMLQQGEIETWDGLYCYLGDLGGTPMRVYA